MTGFMIADKVNFREKKNTRVGGPRWQSMKC